MSQAAINHLDHVIPNSRFAFGAYLGDGFDIWKKNAGPFIGFGLVYICLSMALSAVPIIGQLIGSLFLTPCLTAGAYYYAHKTHRNDSPEFGDFFAKFKSYGPLIIVSIISSLIPLFLCIPFIFSVGMENLMNWGEPELMATFILEDFDPKTLLFLLPAIIATILFGFAIPFIIFFNLNPIDAIKYSVKLIAKHFILFFLFTIVVSILACLGFILLIIGIFLTFTIIYPIFYASFNGLTKLDLFDDSEGANEVTSHLVER